ncbi:hypothetical protein J2Y69_002608 [Microbacterium resistens]|uniref:IPT/TIG domain-containing protein n=1 Tax=Microbacterium resistens TaxID=156977 RepID=A0ABU1SEG7_9MICO|nr:hypothetical protein [Microbacterium resistens]MDR6868000.1 hypothetical protein [Microbacterium resistens]
MTFESTSTTKGSGPSRRSVLKTAAWSVPVIAAASAMPLAAASVPADQQNVRVSSSCYGINILGIGQSFPQFTIAAVGSTVRAGSTFNITGTGIGNLTFGDSNGLGFFNFLNGNTVQFTLTRDIPAGSSATVQVTGFASAQALRTYTMSVGTIIGNANTNKADDAAGQTLLGVSLFGVLIGYCGR